MLFLSLFTRNGSRVNFEHSLRAKSQNSCAIFILPAFKASDNIWLVLSKASRIDARSLFSTDFAAAADPSEAASEAPSTSHDSLSLLLINRNSSRLLI